MLTGELTKLTSSVAPSKHRSRTASSKDSQPQDVNPRTGPIRTLQSLTRRLSSLKVAPSESSEASKAAKAKVDALGEVVIEVVRATGLKAPSIGEWRLMIGQKPSPFVKLALRGHEQSTKKEEKTLFPVWNERLVWRGKRGELCKPKMLVDVMAWDPLTPASMGRAEVDLAPLLVDDTCDLMVLLQVRMHAQRPLCSMPSLHLASPFPHLLHAPTTDTGAATAAVHVGGSRTGQGDPKPRVCFRPAGAIGQK